FSFLGLAGASPHGIWWFFCPIEGNPFRAVANYEQLRQHVLSDSSCKVVDEARVTQVECLIRNTTYYFTKLDHVAHRGVVRGSLVLSNEGYHVDTNGYFFDSGSSEQ